MKKQQNRFSELFNWAEQQDSYWVEGSKIEFAEQMLARMDTLKISRKELACRLGTSPAYVTKILRGSANFTLELMVRIAQVLNCELKLTFQEKTAEKGKRGVDCGKELA